MTLENRYKIALMDRFSHVGNPYKDITNSALTEFIVKFIEAEVKTELEKS